MPSDRIMCSAAASEELTIRRWMNMLSTGADPGVELNEQQNACRGFARRRCYCVHVKSDLGFVNKSALTELMVRLEIDHGPRTGPFEGGSKRKICDSFNEFSVGKPPLNGAFASRLSAFFGILREQHDRVLQSR